MIAVEIYFKSYNDYYCIDVANDGSVFRKETVSNISSETYLLIENQLPIDSCELVLILRSHATENKKIFPRIISCYKNIEKEYKIVIKKIWFFLEDMIKLEPNESFKETNLIKKITHETTENYEVFHCEKISNLKYFDWYVSEQINGIFSKKTQPLDCEFANKICCLNSRFDKRRYIISAWLATKSFVDFSQDHSIELVEVDSWDLTPNKYKQEVSVGAKLLWETKRSPIDPDYISNRAVDELIKRTKDSFCSVVTESRYETPWPNFSEKTLRVIASGRPFILLAPVGTLKLLHDLGIKTFSDYWDESYDAVEDPKERLSMVMDQIDALLNRTDHRQMLESMMPILKHNQEAMKAIPKKMLTIS